MKTVRACYDCTTLYRTKTIKNQQNDKKKFSCSHLTLVCVVCVCVAGKVWCLMHTPLKRYAELSNIHIGYEKKKQLCFG